MADIADIWLDVFAETGCWCKDESISIFLNDVSALHAIWQLVEFLLDVNVNVSLTLGHGLLDWFVVDDRFIDDWFVDDWFAVDWIVDDWTLENVKNAADRLSIIAFKDNSLLCLYRRLITKTFNQASKTRQSARATVGAVHCMDTIASGRWICDCWSHTHSTTWNCRNNVCCCTKMSINASRRHLLAVSNSRVKSKHMYEVDIMPLLISDTCRTCLCFVSNCSNVAIVIAIENSDDVNENSNVEVYPSTIDTYNCSSTCGRDSNVASNRLMVGSM